MNWFGYDQDRRTLTLECNLSDTLMDEIIKYQKLVNNCLPYGVGVKGSLS